MAASSAMNIGLFGVEQSMSVKIGLFGAQQGNYLDIDYEVPLKLKKLEAWTDYDKGIINGIQFTCIDKDLNPLPPVNFGPTNGTKHILFDIEQDPDPPEDYVVDLYGKTENKFVHKLGVKTNKGAGGTCGKDTGKYFNIPVVGGSIVAFFARTNDIGTLSAVGAYAVPYRP